MWPGTARSGRRPAGRRASAGGAAESTQRTKSNGITEGARAQHRQYQKAKQDAGSAKNLWHTILGQTTREVAEGQLYSTGHAPNATN